MAYNYTPFKDKAKQIEDWLKKEYSSLRTGQATPAVLDNVQVESYGARVPLNQVANVSIEDSKTLRIAPWDPSSIKDIERAIQVSDLGLSVRVDETGLRASFPALTGERRLGLVKIAKEKLEEAKISVRKERERVLKDFDAQEDAGKMTEDDVKRGKTELQKHVDEINKKLEELKDRKEKEIMS